MNALVRCLLVAGLSLPPCVQAEPLSKVERLEQELMAAPAGNVNKLHHLRLALKGKAAVEERWTRLFQASEGGDKERLALLLALNASPPYRHAEVERSKRWLQHAGENWQAHSLRAVIASLEDDADGAIAHLDDAFEQKPIFAFQEQILQAQKYKSGRPLSREEELAFWTDRWHETEGQSVIRLQIANWLTAMHGALDDREKWVEVLRQSYGKNPDSNWVEACALAVAFVKGLKADHAHRWIERARLAGAPPAVILSLKFAGSGGVNAASVYLAYLRTLPPEDSLSSVRLVQGLMGLRELAPQVAAYVKSSAPMLLEDPMALLALTETFQTPAVQGNNLLVKDTILQIIEAHCKASPDDLEAKYVFGRLLTLTNQRKTQGVEVLSDFLRRASGRISEPVMAMNALSPRSGPQVFQLRFPPRKLDRAEPEAAPKPVPSTFAFATLRKDPDDSPDYPNWQYFDQTGHAETVGDLVLAGLWHLLETGDIGLFKQRSHEWVDATGPPFRVRLSLATRADRSKQGGFASELVRQLLEAKEIDAADLVEVHFQKRSKLRPDDVRRIGERLVEHDPANAPAVEMLNLRALMGAKEPERAKALFAKVRGLADPDNEQDTIGLWSCSRQLARICEDKSLELPNPKPYKPPPPAEEESDELERLANYFNRTQTRVTIGNAATAFFPEFFVGAHLFIHPGALVPGRERDVMFSWVMAMTDPALTIYESGFAYHRGMNSLDGLTAEFMARLAKEVREDDRRFAVVRAFYDGKLKPEEQLKRLEKVAERFPEDLLLQITLAAKLMTCGHYQRAVEKADSVRVSDGGSAWIRQAIRLFSARELGDETTAKSAARALMPLTWGEGEREWLAKQLELLGLTDEATAMRLKPQF